MCLMFAIPGNGKAWEKSAALSCIFIVLLTPSGPGTPTCLAMKDESRTVTEVRLDCKGRGLIKRLVVQDLKIVPHDAITIVTSTCAQACSPALRAC